MTLKRCSSLCKGAKYIGLQVDISMMKVAIEDKKDNRKETAIVRTYMKT